MTKSDYELIARVLQQYRGDNPDFVDLMADTFARLLSERNLRFDSDRFLSATGRES